MPAVGEKVRSIAYAVAVLSFLVGAIFSATLAARAGLVAASVGAAGFAVAVWCEGVRAHLRSTAISSQIKAAQDKTRDQLSRLAAEVSRAGSGVRDIDKRLHDTHTKLSEQIDRRNVAVHRRLDRVDSLVDQVAGSTIELGRLVDRVHPEPSAMPFSGGWALGAPTLVRVVEAVLDHEDRRTIVECGSGASTVWIAAALRTLGSGHVYALDHDLHFAQETREHLLTHGLQDWATVIDAPLTDITVDGEMVTWFDSSAVESLPESIDMLLVDGPPGASGPLARKPALSVLGGRLRHGALVVLDDTDRDAEKEIEASWLAHSVDGRRLVAPRHVGRSTFFDVTTEQTGN